MKGDLRVAFFIYCSKPATLLGKKPIKNAPDINAWGG